jgi:hypothetical protein
MKPEITVIRCYNTISQNSHCDAVICALKKLGVPYVYSKGAALPIKTKKVIVWGWKWAKYWREQGKDVLVMEYGYIGDRKKYSSFAWNGLNGYGKFALWPNDGGARFAEQGGVIRDWRYNDDAPVLLLGQLKSDQSLQGVDIEKRYNEWVRKIDRDVVYRPHPEMVRRGIHMNVRGVALSQGTLHEALDNCSYSIAFNSNSLLDSVMYGVPAVAMDTGSMATELCGEAINHVVRPERERRLHEIAWCQFTLEEIAKAWPLRKLLEMKNV